MFEPLKLNVGGKEYSIPSTEHFILIQKVEDAIAGGERKNTLDILLNKGPTYLELARGVAAIHEHVNAKGTAESIYMSIQEDIANGGADNVAQRTHEMVLTLLQVMSPPVHKQLMAASTEKKNKAD